MANELFVSSADEALKIVVLEDERLVEYHQEKHDSKVSVGDINLGIVRKVVGGLNAVFVDIGMSKNGFLHYLDLNPQLLSIKKFVKVARNGKNPPKDLSNLELENDIDKGGKISDVLRVNDLVLVQVEKEPISSKGARLSCELTLPGMYIVLVPFSNDVSVSKKINNQKERKRLKILIESIIPKNFGAIVRTAATGKSVAELDFDLKNLLQKWENLSKKLNTARPPNKVHSELNKANSILRDMMSSGFDKIYTDDQTVFGSLEKFLKQKRMSDATTVKLYNGKIPMFSEYGIEKQIKRSFGKTVNMPTGSYLIIEQTEALVSIDVNSGSLNMKKGNLEETAFRVNMQAAKEIARQLRLRDIGGIIIIDFIDMRKVENRKELYKHLRESMKNDPARHTILPMSRFGLIQITRQRVRSPIIVKTLELCPSCQGTGKINAPTVSALELENTLKYLFENEKVNKLEIHLNPFMAAFFTKGFMSRQKKWYLRYKKWIKIIEDDAVPFTKPKYVLNGNELTLD